MSVEALHARWSPDAGEHQHVVFLVEGMRCAGCARGIERAIGALAGVQAVRVNVATARVAVDWLGRGPTALWQILEAVTRAGFTPLPLAGRQATAEFQRERRAALKRVGLASLGMMQAMMYLTALYGASDIDASMAQLMRIAGMLIVTPVLFYSGAPFLAGAWRDLAGRRLGMDVPVALALLLAWVPSVWNTLRGAGEVYFDSVGMFIFFLSAGRYLEMTLRHQALSSGEALARSLPAEVTRLDAHGAQTRIAATALAAGDRFLVPTGGVVAVDAELAPDSRAGTRACLDESLLTGESLRVSRGAGERIRGGSVNLGQPLRLVARSSVADSTLASMVRLLERAQATRPRLARAADRVASWFVLLILLLALATGLAWMPVDASRAFDAVLAVLVVTCPCALSLATPVALAAASTRLTRLGMLVTRADAIERLAAADTVMFDKTGTLTRDGACLAAVEPLAALPRGQVLRIVAALERTSAHPLAAAFAGHADPAVMAEDLREFAGEGIEGLVGGVRWRLGRCGFVAPEAADVEDDAALFLGSEGRLVARFRVATPLREDARPTVEALRRLGLQVCIASGDSDAAVSEAARALAIRDAGARLAPADKIGRLRALRAAGHRVCMLGDGINDGPVLAAADVSCAMGQGSAIAQSASDLLLVHDDLTTLPRAIGAARAAMRVVRQNLGWALLYNLAAVPLAALGLVPPWLAALGMSLSSLGVVLNARRLAAPGAAA
ncbi:MAG TPA: cation-translocating P-type ATPase [Steroidobacteraceae bacterium]|nr:cation-translocating P-type ATPase [Steroidobacteraceae bacterium]